MPTLPHWLSFLSYILWPLFVALVLLMVFFTFTVVANIIAAPFNGFLSEKVEAVIRGVDDSPAFSWAELIAMLPRMLGLFVLSFIPVANIIAAPLWLLFGVWMMAIQYIDYPADNHKLGWNEMLGWLKSKRWQSLSFGGIVYAALLIPVVNLLMMPAAVAGATLFWVRVTRRRCTARHACAWLNAENAGRTQDAPDIPKARKVKRYIYVPHLTLSTGI